MTGYYSYITGERLLLLSRTRMSPATRARLEGRRIYAPMVAKTHRVTVDIKTGARTVETTDHIELMRPRPKASAKPPKKAPEYEGPDQEEGAIVKAEIAAMVARVSEMTFPWLATLTEKFIADVTRLQAVFCDVYNEIQSDAAAPLTISRLKKRDRTKTVAWARSVCVLLCRQILGGSEPNIARLFGYADHTSARHSIDSAPRYMRAEPVLAEVHARVLARYEAQQ